MTNILHPNKVEFDQLLNEKGVLFVDFFAEWCGPCKMLAPEIEKLADAYTGKAKVIKIDVDAQQALAMDYQVQSIPTIIVFKDGKVINKELGFRPYPALAKMIDENL